MFLLQQKKERGSIAPFSQALIVWELTDYPAWGAHTFKCFRNGNCPTVWICLHLLVLPIRRLQHVLPERREPLLHPADPEVSRLGRHHLPPDGHERRRTAFLQPRWGAGMLPRRVKSSISDCPPVFSSFYRMQVLLLVVNLHWKKYFVTLSNEVLPQRWWGLFLPSSRVCCHRSGGGTWKETQRCGSTCSPSSAQSSATPTSSLSGKSLFRLDHFFLIGRKFIWISNCCTEKKRNRSRKSPTKTEWAGTRTAFMALLSFPSQTLSTCKTQTESLMLSEFQRCVALIACFVFHQWGWTTSSTLSQAGIH